MRPDKISHNIRCLRDRPSNHNALRIDGETLLALSDLVTEWISATRALEELRHAAMRTTGRPHLTTSEGHAAIERVDRAEVAPVKASR